jgi:glycogen debranching enzyme
MAPLPLIRAALVRTLCDLGRVNRLVELGSNGPMLASAGANSLFHCLFGRDSLRMAMDLLEDFPLVARATLLELARLQGVRNNPRAEEEPGRILHEHRYPDDPYYRELHEHWDFPYYGSVDSTPQWINLLAAYCAAEGLALLDEMVVDRLGRAVTVRDALIAALTWTVQRLDEPIGHGYLWVRRASPYGIPNQVWEDSADSYYDEQGRILDFTLPYAPVAVQGYVYDALVGAADLLEQTPGPLPPQLETIKTRAADLRSRFLAEFWQPELGTFALALAFGSDGFPRPARVVASSPGHLLASRLLDGTDVAAPRGRLIERLFEPDLLAGAGIRTKSTTAPRFRAGSYHNGSTWPMDTGVIADGLRRHGRGDLADDLETRILNGCALVGGFPEFFRGDPDGIIRVNTTTLDSLVDGTLNRLEQPPQQEQGWTATRIWRILRRGELAASP